VNKFGLLLSTACIGLAQPAWAAQDKGGEQALQPATKPAAKSANGAQTFSTGVARGRDLLDSAISTSIIAGDEIEHYSARSMGEILRNMAGIRVEYHTDDAQTNLTVRGLPMAGSGSKYIQIQEDGLPVVEFGDLFSATALAFVRADINIGSVEAIRGGSASTFASNSPGGVINIISKNGRDQGGALELSTGINYGEKRVDADYGGHLAQDLRFHIGGFYRQGSGPRNTGISDAFRGGQVKFNITKDFTGGYVRLYGKWLDDVTPAYTLVPVGVSGSNDSPTYANLTGFSANKDTLFSRYQPTYQVNGSDNKPYSANFKDGFHAKSRAIGLESQIELGGWTLNEKLRYTANSGEWAHLYPVMAAPASAVSAFFAGPSASLKWATGPYAGTTITSPSTINGNGMLAAVLALKMPIRSMDVLANDLRASRVWKAGHADITTTAGLYYSQQSISNSILAASVLYSVAGGGNAALVDLTTATGIPMTQGGIYGYGSTFAGQASTVDLDAKVRVLAPYGSINWKQGKWALGASVRYDSTKTTGLAASALTGRGAGFAAYDWNGNGSISRPESLTSVIPNSSPVPLNYTVNYASYSAGVNYRISPLTSVFGRYSRGGRASADNIMFTPAINFANGALANPAAGYSPVDQIELGWKWREQALTVNLTGFWAEAKETNLQYVASTSGIALKTIARKYRAYGSELEASYKRGIFSLSGSVTYSHARIVADSTDATVVGNKPRRQADFIYQIIPQLQHGAWAAGVNIVGTTDSYAQDANKLKLNGYTLVSPYVAWQPYQRVTLRVNINNLFDKLALTEASDASIPATGVTLARTINGRTLSASLRYDF
jgi:outer membrane receptor protein involved in Fe transport